MKKILISSLVAILMLMGTVVPNQQIIPVQEVYAETSGDFEYDFYGEDEIGITNYVGSNNKVIIPDQIDGYNVTVIDTGAFCDCVNITNVTIPNSITTIYENAFEGCKKLESISIPDSVTIIGNSAFEDCENLEKVNFGDSLKKIGYDTFRNCKKITSINIPDSVTIIDDSAFEDCENLEKVNFGDSLKEIGNAAFRNCKKITSINIPDSVTIIGDSAFEDCENLEKVNFGDSLKEIEYATFRNCKKITSINISDSVTSISSSAFEDCNNLKNIILNPNNKYFKLYKGVLFDAKLENIVILPGTLDTLYLPKSYAGFEEYGNGEIAIYGFNTKNLKNIEVDSDHQKLSSENGLLYNKDKSHLLTAPCKIDTIKISNKTKYIDIWSIAGCVNLKTIDIPEGVIEISYCAFAYCDNLETINIPSTVKIIDRDFTVGGDFIFTECNNLQSINVNSKNSYYSSQEGALYNKNKTSLLYVPSKLTTLTIPASVIKIETIDEVKGCILFDLKDVLIKCNTGSYALEYAKRNNIAYEIIDPLVQANGIKLNKSTLSLTKGNNEILNVTLTPSNATNKTLTWTSSNPNVASVDQNGRVTAINAGNAIITVTTSNGKTATCKVTVQEVKTNTPTKTKVSITKTKITVKNAIYTGKAIKQKVTIKYGKKTLKNGTDYTLSYKNNKNTGKATITIKGKGNYSGSKTINFYIVPKKVTISSVKSGKKQFTVKYKKVTGASGYQIAYSTSKSKGFKYITVNAKTASKVIKKLKSKKNYFVKVRAYKSVGKKKYYGSYSAIKSIKVK